MQILRIVIHQSIFRIVWRFIKQLVFQTNFLFWVFQVKDLRFRFCVVLSDKGMVRFGEIQKYYSGVMAHSTICFVETVSILQFQSCCYIPKICSYLNLRSSTRSFRNWVSSFILVDAISNNFCL